MKNLSANLLLLLAFGFQLNAQSWLPIPYDQTTYYSISNSDEIIPMKNDYLLLAGSGVNYGIHQQFIYDQFDTCAEMIWNPAGFYGLPSCDFQGFVDEDSVMVIKGINELFEISLSASINDLRAFCTNNLIRLDSISGGLDSVRFYSILENDSTSLVGPLVLSKSIGLMSFPSFKDLEFLPTTGIRMFQFFGATDSGGNIIGTGLPQRQDYLPYFVGDELIFKYVYWATQNQTFVELTEYHHLKLDSTLYGSNSPAELKGVAAKYDWQGFFIGIDSNYSIPLDPNISKAAIPVSVPFWGKYASTNQSILMHSKIEMGANDIRLSVSGYEASICDSFSVIDGYGQTDIFSSVYGLIYKQYNGFAGPPQTWQLCASNGFMASYGTWPTWLGVDESEVSSMRVYPNPASEIIQLNGEVQNAQVSIFDLTGKLVLRSRLNLPNTLDINNLINGVYFLNITSDEGLSETHKLVKQ